MANISFNLQSIKDYLTQNGVVLSQQDDKTLGSIFTDCDTENETGEKTPDGKLTNGEVQQFFTRVSEKLQNISGYIISFQDVLVGKSSSKANENVQQNENPAFQEVKCNLTPEQMQQYDTNLQQAKDIVLNNKNLLELTDAEAEYIKNTVIKAENNNCAARATTTGLIFNYNGGGGVLDVGNIVRIMLHEVTHITLNSYQKGNSKSDERKCETRALTSALKLIEKGEIENFTIIHGQTDITTENFKDDADGTKLKEFIELWLQHCGYKNLPEETQNIKQDYINLGNAAIEQFNRNNPNAESSTFCEDLAEYLNLYGNDSEKLAELKNNPTFSDLAKYLENYQNGTLTIEQLKKKAKELDKVKNKNININCGDRAMQLQEEYQKQGIPCEVLSFADVDNSYIKGKNFYMDRPEHAFCVIGLDKNADTTDPSTWGENAVIVDAWLGKTFSVEDGMSYYKEFFRYNHDVDENGNNKEHKMYFGTREQLWELYKTKGIM